MASRSYLGKGKVYFKNITNPTAKRLHIGNVSKFDVALTEDVHEQKDYRFAGGGIDASVSRISKAEGSFALHDFSESNMALATRGKNGSAMAGSIVDEAVTADLDGLTLLAFASPTAVVVKDAAGLVTYVNGVDYEVSSAGITTLATGSITEGEALKVSYTHGGQSAVQALVSGQDEYQVVFEGLNEADSDKAVVIVLHRCKFSPAKNLSFIGDDFGILDLSCTILKSKTVGNGTSISNFMTITYAA